MLVTGLYWRQLYAYLAAERRRRLRRRVMRVEVRAASRRPVRRPPVLPAAPSSRPRFPGTAV